MRNLGTFVLILVWGCSSSSSRSIGGVPVVAKTTHTGGASLGTRLASAMRSEYRAQADKVTPPLSLVPSDGSELALASLAATVTIEGPLAHTELRLKFTNTENRQREGRFGITLPPGATVGRFAMKIGGAFREARVVSRARGREVYESFLHKRVDPALLERDLGNQFSARVFPIAPNETKEIILAYEHLVSDVQPYTLALKGLPAVPEVKVTIDHDGVIETVARASDRYWSPPDDVTVPIERSAGAISSADAFIARIDPAPAATGDPAAALDSVLVLVDTSASRTTVMGRQGIAVQQLLARLPRRATVAIAAFDHTVTELYRGPASRAGDITGPLFERGALGASDLGGALAYAANQGFDRVILIGDGAPTLGEREPTKLAAGLDAVSRIDAVQIGASVDRDTLQRIVRAGRLPGAILDGRDLGRVAKQLATAVQPPQSIRVAGAVKSWPATTRGVAPGDPIWVFGLRTRPGPLTVRIGDRNITLTPGPGDARRIRRAVAGAEIAELTERATDASPADQPALAKQIETLALAHELVSTQTSLLVLESDADENAMLGPRTGVVPAVARPVAAPAEPVVIDDTPSDGRGELIVINDRAPQIDVTSTSQGIRIDREYLRAIPIGRSFESALGAAAAGAVSFSGSTSIENRYHVDGIAPRDRGRGTFRVKADVMSSLAQDYIATSLSRSAFLGDDPEDDDEDEDAPSIRAPDPVAPASPFAVPHLGTFARITHAITTYDPDRALELATHWQLAEPGDVAAMIALGEAFEARGSLDLAARAYGSILDLYPNRADLLRAAGQRFDRLARVAGTMAIDAYRRAIAERPDQATGYRLLAFALVRADRPDEALEILYQGMRRTATPAVLAVFGEDRAIIEAVIAAKDPAQRTALLGPTPPPLSIRPSIRFVLSWETDANDVDLHVRDATGEEALYNHPSLRTGGRLTRDLTDGYGPEQFTILQPRAFPYQLAVHYYRKGPMGIGLGTVQVIRHDGNGGVTVEDRPFVIQNDDAMIELGAVAAN